MPSTDHADPQLDEYLDDDTKAFYLRSLELLDRSGIPYLVGGAYSLNHHARVVRHTKDLDVFVKPTHADRALATFERADYRVQRTFPHWLSKAFRKGDDTTFIDIIYGSPTVPYYESGYQGTLQNAQLDATGNRLQFDFIYGGEYGPLHYDLQRVTP